MGAVALAGIALIVLVLLMSIVWTIASRPVRTTSELVAEAQLLVAGASIVISAVLAGTTIYYARWSRNLVLETHETRIAEQAHREGIARRETHQQLVAATSALVGCASDVIALGSVLSILIRARRVWRLRRVELAMQPVIAASQAIDRVRYVASADVLEAAHELFDQIVEYFHAASVGAPESRLVGLAQDMRCTKSKLTELVLASGLKASSI